MDFTGTYLNKFDEAGRISIPAKMRDELRKDCPNNSLMAYCSGGVVKILPKHIYDEKMRNMAVTARKNAEAFKIFRKLNASAYSVEINSAGRISIPSQIREEANLGAECYVLGVLDTIEIWNKERWDIESSKIDLAASSDRTDLAEFIDISML